MFVGFQHKALHRMLQRNAVNWNIKHKDKGHITIPFISKEGLVESLVEDMCSNHP